MSGFTGAGYPKAVPAALVSRVTDAAARGEHFTVSVWTGASTAPELDGALATAGGIDLRMPYQSDPVSRAKINAGLIDYLALHLSHVAQMVWEGFFGHLDVEVSGNIANAVLAGLDSGPFRPLTAYTEATASGSSKHTPHLLEEALSWHVRYLQQGTMQSG